MDLLAHKPTVLHADNHQHKQELLKNASIGTVNQYHLLLQLHSIHHRMNRTLLIVTTSPDKQFPSQSNPSAGKSHDPSSVDASAL